MHGLVMQSILVIIFTAMMVVIRGVKPDEGLWFDPEDVKIEADELMRSLFTLNLPNERNTGPYYKSRIDFKPGIMKPLYLIAPRYVQSITQRQPFPPGFIQAKGNTIKVQPIWKQRKPLEEHYNGMMRVIYVLLAIGIIILVVGILTLVLYFVLASKQWYSGKYLIIFFSIILLVLLGFCLTGAVYAINNENRMVSGLDAIPLTLQNALDDGCSFLNETRQEVHYFMIDLYGRVLGKITPLLDSIGHIVDLIIGRSITKSSSMRRQHSSFASSLSTVHRAMLELELIRSDLHTVQDLTASLRLNSDHLNAGLSKIKVQIDKALEICKQPQCSQLMKTRLKQLDIRIHYSQIPDVLNLLSNVTQILNSNVTSELSAGQNALRANLAVDVGRSSRMLERILNNTGGKLKSIADLVDLRIDTLIKTINDQKSVIKEYRLQRRQYEPYRRMVGLGTPIFVIMIAVILVIGIIAAAISHSFGLWILFVGTNLVCLLSIIILLVTGVFFAIGVGAERFICDPLFMPTIGNRMWDVVEDLVNLEETTFQVKEDPGFTLARSLQRCHYNMTMYKVLDLHRVVSVEKIREQVNIELKKAIDNLLTFGRSGKKHPEAPKQKSEVEDQAEEDVHIQDGVQKENSSGVERWKPKKRMLSPFAEQQLRALANIAHTHCNLGMVPSAVTALRVHYWLRNNSTMYRDSILRFIDSALEAGSNMASNMYDTMLKSVIDSFTGMLFGYLTTMVYSTNYVIGSCAPISNAYNITVLSLCQNVLLPHHGVWLSLAWSSAFLLPIVLVAAVILMLFRVRYKRDRDKMSFRDFIYTGTKEKENYLDLSKVYQKFSLDPGTNIKEKNLDPSKVFQCSGEDDCTSRSYGSKCNPLVLAVSTSRRTRRCPCLAGQSPTPAPESSTELPSQTSRSTPARPYLVPR